LSILESSRHELRIAHGLTLMTPSLRGWEAFPTPGALTHTRITWAFSPSAPQVPGSPLCPWCFGHPFWRGARQRRSCPPIQDTLLYLLYTILGSIKIVGLAFGDLPTHVSQMLPKVHHLAKMVVGTICGILCHCSNFLMTLLMITYKYYHPNLLFVHSFLVYFVSALFCNEILSWMIQFWMKNNLSK
jgi:hypothetical protein